MFSEDSISELGDFAAFEFYQAGFDNIAVIVDSLKEHKGKIADQVILSIIQRPGTLLLSEEDAVYELKDIILRTVARMRRTPAYQYNKIILAPQSYGSSWIRYGHKVFRTSHDCNQLKWWNW